MAHHLVTSVSQTSTTGFTYQCVSCPTSVLLCNQRGTCVVAQFHTKSALTCGGRWKILVEMNFWTFNFQTLIALTMPDLFCSCRWSAEFWTSTLEYRLPMTPSFTTEQLRTSLLLYTPASHSHTSSSLRFFLFPPAWGSSLTGCRLLCINFFLNREGANETFIQLGWVNTFVALMSKIYVRMLIVQRRCLK